MLLFNAFLITHIITGVICLVTGIFAMSYKKKKGKHTTFGEIYHWS
jgi:heme/copper-type cytochrome/quinol oxidase subunit 2